MLKTLLYAFWVAYFFTKKSPVLISLYIKKEYLYLRLFLNELFGR